MPGSFKSHLPASFCMLALQTLAACSLTYEPFQPQEVVTPLSPPEVDAEVVDATAPSSPSSVDAGAPGTCSSSSELPTCMLPLVGLGEACSSDRQCALGACVSGVCSTAGCAGSGEGSSCAVATCGDGLQNQDETAVDCGGRCDPCEAPDACVCGSAACGLCPLGAPCGAGSECVSGRCTGGSCQTDPCADGLQNGLETDTDCGGSDQACPRCLPSAACSNGGDCSSGTCLNGACEACSDGTRNGSETDLDCGGACEQCTPGLRCEADLDCASGICEDGRCCGGVLADCTRCARRLVTQLTCDNNGPAAANDCNSFLQCLADNSSVCSTRYSPGCTDDPDGVCNHNSFGGNAGPGVTLADSILGSASCFF